MGHWKPGSGWVVLLLAAVLVAVIVSGFVSDAFDDAEMVMLATIIAVVGLGATVLHDRNGGDDRIG